MSVSAVALLGNFKLHFKIVFPSQSTTVCIAVFYERFKAHPLTFFIIVKMVNCNSP